MDLSVASLADSLHWQMWDVPPAPSAEDKAKRRREQARQALKLKRILSMKVVKRRLGRRAQDALILVQEYQHGKKGGGAHKIIVKLKGRKYPTFLYLVDNEHVYMTSTERSGGKLIGAYVPGVTIEQLYEDIQATAAA